MRDFELDLSRAVSLCLYSFVKISIDLYFRKLKCSAVEIALNIY